MWYFAWILGLGFAVLLAILSAVWVEFEKGRLEAFASENNRMTDDDTQGDIDKPLEDSERYDEAQPNEAPHTPHGQQNA